MIYSTMYHREYKYASVKSSNYSAGAGAIDPELSSGEESDDIPAPVDPIARGSGTSKPFIPVTRVNADSRLPFGAALDAPLG